MEQRNIQCRPCVMIDCWSSKATSRCISLLPPGSRILVLGNLSESSQINISPLDLFMHHKIVEGFNLLKYMEKLSKERLQEFFRLIRDDFDSQGGIFYSQCKEAERVFKLEDIS